MSAEELRSRVNHDVGTVLQRTNQIRCAEGVVNDKWYAMLVSHGSYAFEVEHVRVGIAKGFGVHHFGIRLDGSFEGLEVVHVKNGVRDALRRERVGNQVIRTAVEVVGSHDMVASLYDILQSVGDGGCTRGHSQTCHTTFEGCDTIFKDALSRVGQTSVDVACITETETVGSVL